MSRSFLLILAASLVVIAGAGVLLLGLVVAGATAGFGPNTGTPVGPTGSTCTENGAVPSLSAIPGPSTPADAVEAILAGPASESGDTPAVEVALVAGISAGGDGEGIGGHGGEEVVPGEQGAGPIVALADASDAATSFAEPLAALPYGPIPPSALGAAAAPSGSLERPEATGPCGEGSGPLAGPSSADGLPAGYVVPPGTPGEHAAVVAFAIAQLGKPYVWGASGPNAYDCSGLTMAAWASVGVALDHYTGDQQQEGVTVELTGLVPGDLVLVPGADPPGPGIAGHVGIYLGDGLVLSAIDPTDGVAVQSWQAFTAGGLVALRDPALGR